jgi:hypothetical protein
MPCDALARVNATIAQQTLVAELFAQQETAKAALIQLASQLEEVSDVIASFRQHALEISLRYRGRSVRCRIAQASGQLTLTGGNEAFLGRLRALIEELGGALMQERIVRTLQQIYGAHATEVEAGGTVRRLTLRL